MKSKKNNSGTPSDKQRALEDAQTMDNHEPDLTPIQLAQLAASVLPSIVLPEPPGQLPRFSAWTRSTACPGILYEATRIAHLLWLESRKAISTEAFNFDQPKTNSIDKLTIKVPIHRRGKRQSTEKESFATWDEFLVQIVGHFASSKKTETYRFETAKRFLRYHAEHVVCGPNPNAFRESDILNVEEIFRICRRASIDSIYGTLWSRLTLKYQGMILKNEIDPSRLAQIATMMLNRAAESGSIYTEQRFVGVKLSQETKDLLETPHVKAANRSLLVDAFPNALTRDQYESTVKWLLEKLQSEGLDEYDWQDLGVRFFRWWRDIGAKEGKRMGGLARQKQSRAK